MVWKKTCIKHGGLAAIPISRFNLNVHPVWYWMKYPKICTCQKFPGEDNDDDPFTNFVEANLEEEAVTEDK